MNVLIANHFSSKFKCKLAKKSILNYWNKKEEIRNKSIDTPKFTSSIPLKIPGNRLNTGCIYRRNKDNRRGVDKLFFNAWGRTNWGKCENRKF